MESIGLFMVYGVVCIALFIVVRNRNRIFLTSKGLKSEYDERQVMDRWKACGIAFFCMLGYELIKLVITSETDITIFTQGFFATAGIWIGLTVYFSVCVWKHAFMGITNSTKYYRILLVVLGLMNLVLGCYQYIDGRIDLTSSRLERFPMQFILAGIFLFISILWQIRISLDNREED